MGGDGRTEREVHAKKTEQCCLSSCVQQKNRGNLFEFQSTSSPHTEGWTLHPLPPTTTTSSSSSPPTHTPPHPAFPFLLIPPHHQQREEGRKKNLLLRAQLCMHFFYLVLVDVMGKLSLSLSPSLPPASSPRRSAVCLGYARAFHRAARSTPNAGLPSVSGNFKVMPPPPTKYYGWDI